MKCFLVFAASVAAVAAVAVAHAAPFPASFQRALSTAEEKQLDVRDVSALVEDAVKAFRQAGDGTLKGQGIKSFKQLDLGKLIKANEPAEKPLTPRVSQLGASKWVQARKLVLNPIIEKLKVKKEEQQWSPNPLANRWALLKPFIKQDFSWRTRDFPRPSPNQIMSQLQDMTGGHPKSSHSKRREDLGHSAAWWRGKSRAEVLDEVKRELERGKKELVKSEESLGVAI